MRSRLGTILPIAFDSFGVRSMSTYLQVGDLHLVIDPGVALGPTRYGMEPTQAEFEALEYSRALIMELSKKAEVVVITHYHYDHHPFPQDSEMYRTCFSGKVVFAKDRKQNINLSGKQRGKIFEDNVSKLVKQLEWADGKETEIKGVELSFSPAVWHGDVGSKVGTVIMVNIEKGGKSVLFGSDAQSLADPAALRWVLDKNPDFMILDGYPTIFVGWRMSQKAFEASKENLKKAISETQAEEVILDHHLLRDINYKEKISDVLALAEKKGKKLLSAAEFLGLENFFLEAWRKEIHKGERKVDVKGYYRKLCEKIGVSSSLLRFSGVGRQMTE
jgi:predicted metallo-beta-lactamase superfamily hydrolase